MILHRLATSVRKQDWFAVVIETLIVVLGVFIGLQVNNWNEARIEAERAAVYEKRLKEDLSIEYDFSLSLIDYMNATHSAGHAAYLGLSGQADMSDADIMLNAFRASQYNWYERRRATFDELVSVGAFGLIADVELREAAFSIYSTPLFEIMRDEGGNAEYRRLFREIIEPDLADLLRRQCGDRHVDTGYRLITLIEIDYSCAPDAPDELLAAGVSALRNDPQLLRALKLRTAQRAGRILDLTITLESIRLAELLGKEKQAS